MNSQLPYWYFQKEEALQARQKMSADISIASIRTFANLEKVENKPAAVISSLLSRNWQMRTLFAIAEQTLQQSQIAENAVILIEKAQDGYDKALANLDALQLEYEQILTTAAAEEVLDKCAGDGDFNGAVRQSPK